MALSLSDIAEEDRKCREIGYPAFAQCSKLFKPSAMWLRII